MSCVQTLLEKFWNDKAVCFVIEAVIILLDANNIHICILPPNTTNLLQPMDISVNKPANQFIKKQLEQWYCEEVLKQLGGKDMD